MPPKSPISKRERLVTKLGKLKKKVDLATRTLKHSDEMWAKHKASEPKSAVMIAFHNKITAAHKVELEKQSALYEATQLAIDLTDADEACWAQNLKLHGPPPPKEKSSLLNEWP